MGLAAVARGQTYTCAYYASSVGEFTLYLISRVVAPCEVFEFMGYKMERRAILYRRTVEHDIREWLLIVHGS